MTEWEFQLLEEKTQLESVCVFGIDLKLGDRVKLWPKAGGDIFDLALAGQTATIEAIEVDFENRVHIAVTIDADPGREFGVERMPGHRFFFAPDEVELLQEAGASSIVKPQVRRESEAGISTHQQGSCRMGKDPASSVVDASGRVHGVPNVYVADGSLLPNPGGANPSLTLQALAYWVSEKVNRQLV